MAKYPNVVHIHYKCIELTMNVCYSIKKKIGGGVNGKYKTGKSG